MSLLLGLIPALLLPARQHAPSDPRCLRGNSCRRTRTRESHRGRPRPLQKWTDGIDEEHGFRNVYRRRVLSRTPVSVAYQTSRTALILPLMFYRQRSCLVVCKRAPIMQNQEAGIASLQVAANVQSNHPYRQKLETVQHRPCVTQRQFWQGPPRRNVWAWRPRRPRTPAR